MGKLTQAAIEGIISTSKTFQSVKETCRDVYNAVLQLGNGLSALAMAVQRQSYIVQQHEQEIQRLKMMHMMQLQRLKENAIELSFPELEKPSEKEEKPN